MEEMLNPPTDLFLGVEELKICNSLYVDDLAPFTGLCNNCKNIKKLTIDFSEGIREFLLEILPNLVQLEELHLSVDIDDSIWRLVARHCHGKSILVCNNEGFCEEISSRSKIDDTRMHESMHFVFDDELF